MATVGVFPPDETSKAAQQAVTGTRLTPGVVSALDGPIPAGPEVAGAVTVLHTTFADADGAQRGYRNFAAIKAAFRDRAGFVRWLTFNDGPHGYALGFWRRAEDVLEFLNTPAHRAMVTEQHERPFEYSQFAGIWVAHTVGRRRLYCERCHTATAAPAEACQGCGNPLHDPFMPPSSGRAGDSQRRDPSSGARVAPQHRRAGHLLHHERGTDAPC